MNIPWKPSDSESQLLTLPAGGSVPTLGFGLYTAGVDVRGYDWIEFTITLSGNIGGDPVTQLYAHVEYGESTGDLADIWYPVTVEDVAATGEAQQVDWEPRRLVDGADAVWRLPVAVHGQQMRLLLKGNATPDAGAAIAVHAYRRSF